MGWMGAAMGWMGALGMHEAFNACYAGARGASRALRRGHAFFENVGPYPTSTDLYLKKETDSWQNNYSVCLHAARFAFLLALRQLAKPSCV